MFTTGAADQGEEEQAGYLGLHRGIFSRFAYCHQDEPSICGCQGRSLSAVRSAAQNEQGIVTEQIASNKTAIFIATTLLKTIFFASTEVA